LDGFRGLRVEVDGVLGILVIFQRTEGREAGKERTYKVSTVTTDDEIFSLWTTRHGGQRSLNKVLGVVLSTREKKKNTRLDQPFVVVGCTSKGEANRKKPHDLS
jgi:hypothetical protein